MDSVKLLIDHADWYREKPEVELLTVHLPLPKLGGMSAVVGKKQIDDYYREEGEKCLAEAKKALERAGISYQPRILVGPIAETIAKHAKDSGSDLIYIGTHGRTGITGALLGSTASKVLHISDVPVLLVK
jgi:nucleotide-binding universal stress UspA family protein